MCLSGCITAIENLSMDLDLIHCKDSNAASGLCSILFLEFRSGCLEWLRLQNNFLCIY